MKLLGKNLRGAEGRSKAGGARAAHAGGEIHLVLTDDEEIALINGLYRKIHKPTDVVSLSYLEKEEFPEQNILGEIMISVETAARQAKKQGHGLKRELQFLFVHGLLHIFGYDHESPAERRKMFALQEKILR
jgi:probable rRNA maturation factor